MAKLRKLFPRIGMRIIKSTIAVGICLLIYYLAGKEEIPFFLVIAALQSLQPYTKDVRHIAARNVFGTLEGAFCALIILLSQRFVLGPGESEYLFYCFFVTIGIAVALYGSVVLGHGESAYFTAVVYLSIVVVHLDNRDPFMYVLQRLVETLVGISVGVTVNAIRIPRRKVKDTLFVAALDEVLQSESSILPEYCKVEMNRLLDDGVRLSIITQHSSASFWEAAGNINFKMPLILLDGAVLYAPAEKRYLRKVELPWEDAAHITALLEDEELTLIQSAIVDDSVIMFNQRVSRSAEAIFRNMRRSTLRNIISRPLPEGLNVVYVLCIGTEEALDEACRTLSEDGNAARYKILRYKHEQEGMGYMRIFSADADRQKMLDTLRRMCGLEKLRSFGSNGQLYDVCVRAAEGENIVKALRREAEPYFWRRTDK